MWRGCRRIGEYSPWIGGGQSHGFSGRVGSGWADFQVLEAVEGLWVGPGGFGSPGIRKPGEVLGGVFVGALGADHLAFGEGDEFASEGKGLVVAAGDAYFDAALFVVPEDGEVEGVGVEVGVGLSVEAFEEVESEGFGDALGVVIGGDDDRGVFAEVDADEELPARAEEAGDVV